MIVGEQEWISQHALETFISKFFHLYPINSLVIIITIIVLGKEYNKVISINSLDK